MNKRLVIIGLYILIAITAQAKSNLQKFEGSINFKKETVYDTSFVTIQVKGNLIRLDEFDRKKNLINTLIINLENEKVLALSPKRKLFYELRPSRAIRSPYEDTVIIRTKNEMVLDGYTCCQVRVKCVSRDTETSFWVAHKDFPFFNTMNKILQNIKSDVNVFSYFPDADGAFPMLIVERTLLRKEKMKIQVTGIKEVALSESLFTVPPEYQKIEQ
jgi:hypothetical protein